MNISFSRPSNGTVIIRATRLPPDEPTGVVGFIVKHPTKGGWLLKSSIHVPLVEACAAAGFRASSIFGEYRTLAEARDQARAWFDPIADWEPRRATGDDAPVLSQLI